MEIVEAIKKLNKIIKVNEWSEKDSDNFVFDSFCELFLHLDDNKKVELILELVERYLWVSYNEYQTSIVKAFESIEISKLISLKKIYLFPIIKPEDTRKIKSSHNLIYLIKGVKRLMKKYNRINFEIINQFETLKDAKFHLNCDEALFLVDDYLGSGETLEACLFEIKQNKTITNSKIVVILIASQNEIFEKIESEGISIYTNYRLRKGISDYNFSPALEEKKDLMIEMEKMIPGGSHFSLGYKQSEGLITLIRTPDNTFPIFWKQHRKGGKKFDAPFSREELIES